ncbi:MAG: hypothetical protein FWB96_12190 [Defluviitaleaceae bacterium]|nr:hypothetical protein [Defluviitaleaceae bacterium]MCL2263845.1 hypothetical protein [Defluviitaleaceae bacterium]
MAMKIDQHFYTREKRGLYTSSAGYDTVAKSHGLCDSFVKEKIHPYCVYSGGGANAITLAHFPCGKMLFGQAAFVPTDFTGQRSAFFAHNYILPAEAAGAALADIGKLLLTRFETTVDGGEGLAGEGESAELAELDELPELPELPALPVSPALSMQSAREFPPEIASETVMHIASCVTKSVESAKKTYVILPKFSDETARQEFIRALLVQIYAQIPEGVRHLLGFCTATNEPEKRKGIHLIFLENGTYKTGDTRFSSDFTVDVSRRAGENAPENATRAFSSALAATGGAADVSHCTGENISTLPTYIKERIRAISPANFFAEVNFWRKRVPFASTCITDAEATWLDKNLENLQFETIPSDAIKKGKAAENSTLYVMLSILKTVSTALKSRREIHLRYFLGSYSLSPQNHERTIEILRRIYQNHTGEQTPQHLENMAFLFGCHSPNRTTNSRT